MMTEIKPNTLNHDEALFLVERSTQLASIQSADNIIQFATPALEKRLGVKPGSLIGQSLQDILTPVDYEFMQPYLHAALRGTQIIEEPIKLAVDADDAVWVSIQLMAMPQPAMPQPTQKFAYVAFFTDHTRMRHIEEALASLTFDVKDVPDEKFFQGMVWHTARALDVDYAFITVTHPPFNTVRMLAFWKGDHFAEPYEYNLDDTPCDRVIRHGRRPKLRFKNFHDLFSTMQYQK